MTSRQVQYILTTYEEGSISKAAQKLFVSQPALSQSIQLAERELGAPIFDRRHSPLTLTFAGERYIASAREFQALELNLAHEIADVQQENSGWFRVGISMLRGAALLPHILPTFTARYPKVEIKLFEKGSNSISSLITQNIVDIAFLTIDRISQKQMTMIPLCSERTMLCAGPGSRLAQTVPSGTPVSIRELENETFIAIKAGHGLHEIQKTVFANLNASPKLLFEVESAVLGMRLAASCDALMLCPQIIMHTLPMDGLSIYPLVEEQFSRILCICHRHDTYLSAYMKDFIQMTKDCIRGHFVEAIL